MALEDAKNPIKGVSGPGKYAKRIDRMPSNSYGDTAETAAIAGGAPLARAGETVRPSQAPTVPAKPVTPMFAPSQRPTEPVTNGIDMGPGAGSEALVMRQPDDMGFRASIRDALPVLGYIADLPNTSPETRDAIRRLWDMQ